MAKSNFFTVLKKGLLTIIVLLLLYILIPASIPILLALLTALLLEPTIQFLQRKWIKSRRLSVVIIFSLFLILLSSILYFVITNVFTQVTHFSARAPELFDQLTASWINLQTRLAKITYDFPIEIITEIQLGINRLLERLQSSFIEFFNYERLKMLVSKLPQFLLNLFVYIFALFLLMLELPQLKKRFAIYISKNKAEKWKVLIQKLHIVLFGYIKAELIVSLIILVVTFCSLLFIIPKYAFIMALVIWFVDLLPILGSIIILAPWALYAMLTGQMALGVKLGILAIVLIILRQILETKVMSAQIGLPPLATLISIYVGLQLFGFFGFFIGPLIVMVFVTAKEAGLLSRFIK
ncbi:sporulation integral membrane protein YtvI [Viridibacillus sp. YIM B01967]|uniref:Sporulation integral membrane protein YtvI n=1 Tax=Viridibacillus soli TaxID=2798301 RepID=A0ABS1H7Q4_9BACL|nr:sporulation integral membrane protein YtvI [Viridibacillus soli]MBK3495431.1 sporulation integral membrane protein YtvI [Viridibacillus soli]